MADGREPLFHDSFSPESCPLVGVVPHLFHQLGKSRRPGKRWCPDGWWVDLMLQSSGDKEDPKLGRDVRVCSESFQMHRKDRLFCSGPPWERECRSHWVQVPGLAV